MRRAGRLARVAAGLPVAAVLALALAPEGRLACGESWLDAASPDRAWTLRVCRRPMPFAMPGGGSDAPGWIVLRDSEAAIRGVVHLDMMQLLDDVRDDPAWEPGRVVLPGLAEMPLAPAAGPVSRWFADRLWRLRALTGLVPSDEMSAQW
ncbi:MAG: hypothetical protein PGN34_20740 [Methylobacterium frigidaeris]